jgi:hypothetical protein
MGYYGGGGQLGGRRFEGGRRPRPGQLGRVWVEAQADLAAALVYKRCEPIGEWLQGISRL